MKEYLKNAGQVDLEEKQDHLISIVSSLPHRVDRWIIYGNYYEHFLKTRDQTVKRPGEGLLNFFNRYENENNDRTPIIAATSKTKDGYCVQLDKAVYEIFLQPGQTLRLVDSYQDGPATKRGANTIQVLTTPSGIEVEFTYEKPSAPATLKPQFFPCNRASVHKRLTAAIKAQMGVSYNRRLQNPDNAQVQPPPIQTPHAVRPRFSTDGQLRIEPLGPKLTTLYSDKRWNLGEARTGSCSTLGMPKTFK